MIFIQISFPAGRWHATAWGSHVNEGIPEWPPCPWRLCRALIATWYWKQRREPATLRRLIEKLAAQLPDYLLPEASAAHSRHYMPVNEGKRETRTKVFDTFVHVSPGKSLWIRWNVELTPEEQTLLAGLLAELNYLGRAESLVCAALESALPAEAAAGSWTVPAERSRLRDGELVRLLAPQAAPEYAAWAAGQGAPAEQAGRRKRRALALPESLFAALQLDTADWKRDGWNQPPGARWADYVRPRDCFRLAPRPARLGAGGPLPRVARFAIVSKVPPSITESLSLAERFHQALCSMINPGEHSPALTGRTEAGGVVTGHGHVYYLPECDPHGYVTHVTLHAPGGLDPAASRALGKLRRVWGAEGFDVKTVLLAVGQPEDFLIASPYFHRAKVWESRTPFVPVRHAKSTRTGVPKMDQLRGLQIGSPQHDCWRLLEVVAPELHLVSIRLAGAKGDGMRIRTDLHDIPCLAFQRQRRTGPGACAGTRGYALRIELETPESLPLGLGYGAHFGLGLFAPVE